MSIVRKILIAIQHRLRRLRPDDDVVSGELPVKPNVPDTTKESPPDEQP